MKIKYQLETLTCPSCGAKIKAGVSSIQGVKSVDVLFNASKVVVEVEENTDLTQTISKVLGRLGFRVLKIT